MSIRALIAWGLAVAGFVVLAMLWPDAAARGWRIAFLSAGAPVLGTVLLAAVARLTGAGWDPLGRLVGAAPVLFVAAAALGIAQIAAPLPAHLALWGHPLAVGARAVLAVALLGFAGTRLRAGGGRTFAAVTLALYAACVTPLGMDWLMGGDNVHAVSAAGMMLVVEQIGGACALVLAAGWGSAKMRGDMAKLLVAAALGLSYLAFMDYLIVWYGNLPGRVGWYVVRGTPAMVALVVAALFAGLAVPIAGLAWGRQRIAGASALAGLVLFNLWWVGGGLVVAACAVFALLVLAGGAVLFDGRRRHG